MKTDNYLGTQEDEILMPKRERIRLSRVDGNRDRMREETSLLLWYDTRSAEGDAAGVFSRVSNGNFTGVVLYPDNFETLLPQVSQRLIKVFHVEGPEDWAKFRASAAFGALTGAVVSSPRLDVLAEARRDSFATCFRAFVDDGDSLHAAIANGGGHEYLVVAFRDPTNIPLELVIASLQATETCLIKEITNPADVDDAIVTLGVMEVGADGVMFSPAKHDVLDSFLARLGAAQNPSVAIETATVIRSEPVGMGYRSCIDLATLFGPEEGLLVGSTSQGGVLCCPEVFFLPYMELRPFRVNAGAVHSYIYNFEDRTDYMTELRAGSPVMVVGTDGRTRKAVVGRMKTEVRPLRLIEIEFVGGERANILMQDDWHVRIFSEESKPLNITELKPGDKVLGHRARPGRHVGIKVDEHILEN